jgi:hypothetical protein
MALSHTWCGYWRSSWITTSTTLGPWLTTRECINFEIDAKSVVTKFHSRKVDISELGDAIKECQYVHNTYFKNSCIEFVRRQGNEVAHVLATVAPSLHSFYIFTDVPTCIHTIINNEMHWVSFLKKKKTSLYFLNYIIYIQYTINYILLFREKKWVVYTKRVLICRFFYLQDRFHGIC